MPDRTYPNITPASPTQVAHDRRAQHRPDDEHTAHHDAIFALARASEMHDEDTGSHLLRIRLVVEQIALRLHFEPNDARELGYNAMLHDVGKLRISQDMLQKPGSFTQHERLVMELHTICGERLLSDRPSMRCAARIARSHHEHWDGTGYPDGLAGEEIPIEARITAVADVFDALMSHRAYKKSWTLEDAMTEVSKQAGSKLDPTVVNALKQCDSDGTLRAVFGLTQREGASH